MLAAALRAVEAAAHISVSLRSQPTGGPAEALFLLISCPGGEEYPQQDDFVYKAGSMLNDVFACMVQSKESSLL